MILVLILTFKADMITAVAKGDLKMFRSEQDSNPDLCDTWYSRYSDLSTKLSYTSPTGEGLLCEFMITLYMWSLPSIPRHSAQCSTSWAIRSTGRASHLWVHDNSWKMEVDVQYISKSYNWTAESEASLTASSQFWTLFNQWVEETWKFQASTEF